MSAITGREQLLVNALRAMLVATDETLPEEFPGHTKQFLNTVARPRALAVVEGIEATPHNSYYPPDMSMSRKQIAGLLGQVNFAYTAIRIEYSNLLAAHIKLKGKK